FGRGARSPGPRPSPASPAAIISAFNGLAEAEFRRPAWDRSAAVAVHNIIPAAHFPSPSGLSPLALFRTFHFESWVARPPAPWGSVAQCCPPPHAAVDAFLSCGAVAPASAPTPPWPARIHGRARAHIAGCGR